MEMGRPFDLQVPIGFPFPDLPEGNELTVARVELGEKLFFEKRLSGDATISCASCHSPHRAFSDTVAISPGVHGIQGFRNSPSLANVAYHPYFFMDGGVPGLEIQVLAPIHDATEMDFDILEAAELLRNEPEYQRLSQLAYGEELSSFVITRAIACYERTLIFGNSPYDRYIQGQVGALTEQQLRGKELFFSAETNCSSCHNGFNFTDYSFQNIGLYEIYDDPGRQRISLNDEDLGKFKVPSLRNIELTAPYMHDGSLNTLDDVVSHFISGGHEHPNKSPLVQDLDLDEDEKDDLIAFLRSLTDDSFQNEQ